MGEHLAAVKAYITKFDLERELSNAVNLAIKEDAPDPYRVIIDYLKDLTQDDEDDEDEIIEEHMDVPAMKPRGKREQVMATKFEVPDNWTPPVHEKSESETAFLKDVMMSNRLMKSLAPSDRDMLVKAFRKVEFEPGATIIKQGDKSDNMEFFVLESGVTDISVEGKGTVLKATKGVAFGELALLHNAPRAATCVAEEAVTAFALDMVSFKMILMGKSQQDASDYMHFLKNIPLLQKFDDLDLQNLAGCLKEVEYPADKNIIVEGDEGNNFYIIRTGEVKCTKGGTEVSSRLGKGDFFGELALLSSDKRAATVTTTEPTTVLMLGRSEFVRLFGPINAEIKELAGQKRL
ncbi:hypothetical protein AB1Y20_006980 [Prymnesium parvum]|uniref:Cyclic nucleotide-binding domain-containing protein n=1 Tax=Prymnesium parvum TaxID=97485 RepID=A0AB34J013_PRYPA|mmetsp:Transcript_36069/g.89777  ORF Transcript_36069/g.89777 Transcript_36069/m.89777 type:complete len:349 (+) Transcript_36069:35-1081(+)